MQIETFITHEYGASTPGEVSEAVSLRNPVRARAPAPIHDIEAKKR